MILINTEPGDVHAAHVEAILSRRGVTWLEFDTRSFPSQIHVEMRPTQATKSVRTPTGSFSVESVRAVWHRRPRLSIAHAGVTGTVEKTFAGHQSDALMADLWSGVHCLSVPARPEVYRAAASKCTQLETAAALGLTVPETIVTNDPRAARAFFCEHGGRIISKHLSNLAMRPATRHLARYTELVTHRDLAEIESIRYAPVMLQAYVEKKLELRVTVVGKQVFAAAIDSQCTPRTRDDWRRSTSAAPHRPHELPVDVAARCVALMDRFQLNYSAIDLVLRPDGEYVFLELNPNGQWLWVEHATGLPIGAAIAGLLAPSDEECSS